MQQLHSHSFASSQTDIYSKLYNIFFLIFPSSAVTAATAQPQIYKLCFFFQTSCNRSIYQCCVAVRFGCSLTLKTIIFPTANRQYSVINYIHQLCISSLSLSLGRVLNKSMNHWMPHILIKSINVGIHAHTKREKFISIRAIDCIKSKMLNQILCQIMLILYVLSALC